MSRLKTISESLGESQPDPLYRVIFKYMKEIGWSYIASHGNPTLEYESPDGDMLISIHNDGHIAKHAKNVGGAWKWVDGDEGVPQDVKDGIAQLK